MLARILNKGQIVIPKKIRKQLGLMPGDIVEVKLIGKKITIQPLKSQTEEMRGIVKGKLSLKELEELYGNR